jgi:FLYWCH zinc finger domain
MYFDTGMSHKGLLINSYVFKRHYASNHIVYWQCTLCRRLRCRARAITKVDDPSTVIIKCSEHNHTLEDYKRIPREADAVDEYKIEEVKDD